MTTVVSQTVTGEAESYSSSVAGIDIEAVRAGAGGGPTKVIAAVGDRFTFTGSAVGFPMLSRTTIPDDKIIACYIRDAKPGSRWCGIDLQPGSVLLYSPCAEHVARNEPGLQFSFAIADRDQLERLADVLRVTPERPRRGEVRCLRRSPAAEAIGAAFGRFADIATSGRYPGKEAGDDVLRTMVHMMTDHRFERLVGGTKRVDPHHVVHVCLDYAESVERVPSISELCAAANVSERCLRAAFVHEFDIAPTQYFRAWVLDQAHRRLSHPDTRDLTVTDIATALGCNHLGRFAVRYRAMYGETPSATLRTAVG